MSTSASSPERLRNRHSMLRTPTPACSIRTNSSRSPGWVQIPSSIEVLPTTSSRDHPNHFDQASFTST